MKNGSVIIRVSKEFEQTINFIRAKHLMEGKKPPSIPEITRKISEKITKEDLWYHEFNK